MAPRVNPTSSVIISAFFLHLLPQAYDYYTLSLQYKDMIQSIVKPSYISNQEAFDFVIGIFLELQHYI
jgi:hypothetical protein